MEQVLYDLMDWAGIEELTYSESADPHRLLGSHITEKGLLIQALFPTASAVKVKLSNTGKTYDMELADEAGFFAVLIPRKTKTAYTLLVTYDNGAEEEVTDPYAFGPQYTERELKKFEAGIFYNIYEKMGAHPMTIDGVEGVYFSVWAPCAMRVSVVGDFNLWDGRRHQMRKLGEGDASVFELFIPGLKPGCLYKYEVKTRAGEPMLKCDPYANYAELRPNNASIVWDIGNYQWKDQEWMKKRADSDTKDKPFNIYEVHLGSWIRKAFAEDENGNVVDGDRIIYIYGRYLKERGKLTGNKVVTTIMSNFGLYKALDEIGIEYERTAVGDKYVYENMNENGYRIGGEQSGHIIFRKYATTGDGILTAIKMMEVVLEKKTTLGKLAEPVVMYPQVLKNVRVKDKALAQADEAVQAAVKKAVDALGNDGRILVRESGTEPLIRVMVEAMDRTLCEEYVDSVIEVLKAQGHAE